MRKQKNLTPAEYAANSIAMAFDMDDYEYEYILNIINEAIEETKND